MQISARSDYAVRAMLELASGDAQATPPAITAQQLADGQGLPRKFLEAILSDLRRAGLLQSQRGAEGGYRLSRSAAEIRIGDVIRAVDGPLAEIRGIRPEHASYTGSAAHLSDVWIATRAAVRQVLDETTLAAVVSGDLPAHVGDLLNSPEAWTSR